MKQINSFSKTQLAAESSYQFHLGVSKRIEEETAEKLGITAELPVYKDGIFRMERALEKVPASVFTSKMVDVDGRRDRVLRILQTHLSDPTVYSEADKRAACERLAVLMGGYSNIVYEAQEKETGMCRNLILDLRSEPYKADVELLGLKEWVDRLDVTNEEFDSYVESRIEESQGKVTGGVSVPRRDTEKAYDEIVRRINALALVNGDEAYAGFIDYLNARIAYFKTILSHKGLRQPSSPPINPPEGGEGGSGDDEEPGEL